MKYIHKKTKKIFDYVEFKKDYVIVYSQKKSIHPYHCIYSKLIFDQEYELLKIEQLNLFDI